MEDEIQRVVKWCSNFSDHPEPNKTHIYRQAKARLPDMPSAEYEQAIKKITDALKI